MISVWTFSLHSEQSVFRTAPALKCVLNNKVSTSLTLSRTEGIAVERIQHLNIEFRTEVKKERYRLNLSLSSRLRASNQNLYEVFQIRPVKQTLLFGIKKRGWCYIVVRTHVRQERSEYTLFSMLVRARQAPLTVTVLALTLHTFKGMR